MKTSTYNMIAVFAAASLFASVALAGNNGKSHSGNGNSNSGSNNSSNSFTTKHVSTAKLGGNTFTTSASTIAAKKSVNIGQAFGNKGNSTPNSATVALKKGINIGQVLHQTQSKQDGDGGIKITFGGNPPRGNDCHQTCYNGRCYNSYCYDNYPCYGNLQPVLLTTPVAPVNQAAPLNVGQAFEPFHSNYVVLPGDTFFEVSLKEYGTSANAPQIALFNNLPESAALTPGQTLQLPSIAVDGQLAASRAPIAESLQGASNANSIANTAPVNSNLSNGLSSSVNNALAAPAVEAPRPKVTVGSTLLVDGQTFGDKQGVARLNVGGAALKIEVVEWAGSSVKIRLPQLDLAGAMNADIEVVRADGSLASKTPVELGAATEVALAN